MARFGTAQAAHGRTVARLLATVCALFTLLALSGIAVARTDLPVGVRLRSRAIGALQVRGRWLGLLPVRFDPMPPWPVLASTQSPRSPARGPLRPHPANPRYFANPEGEVVYLTGSHTWTNLQDAGDGNPPDAFDYDAFLDRLEGQHHNFFRLWHWEHTRWGSWMSMAGFRITPHPYVRTGPGDALDGLAKFDLTQFDESYFERLRTRVEEANRRGFYVSVMLFNGWSIEDKGLKSGLNPWPGHPFHAQNNVNGIDGDENGDGQGSETHSLMTPPVLALQEAYVRKVVDTVGDLDNVLYEISNESGAGGAEWQYHMIRFIKQYEASKGRQHPVGMTGLYPLPNGSSADGNAVLAASPADWISPAGDPHFRPLATGEKVIVADTDHLCGICGDRAWVWMSLTRGENPLFMDVWSCAPWWYPRDCHRPEWPSLRLSLGYARDMALRLPLARMTPQYDVASTHHALVSDDRGVYLIYLPQGGSATVDLSGATGLFDLEWFEPEHGRTHPGARVEGGAERSLTAPFQGDAVLLLQRSPAAS